MRDRPILAQCLEYPIGAFGGVEVLVAALVRGLANDFRIVLVSDDDSGSLARSPVVSFIDEHIPWNPSAASTSAARKLVGRFKSLQVEIAHFHAGNYAWGNRIPNRSPLVHVHRAGIPVLSTNHGAFSILDGYCGSHRSLWMKLAVFPVPWIAKVQTVAHAEVEIAVSRNDCRDLSRWYWPVRHKFRQLYHSKLDVSEPAASPIVREKAILCVGTIGHRKGQVVLARAFASLAARHPEWQLILVGRNGAPELMAEIVCIQNQPGLRDRIILDDSLSDGAIAELMRKSAIFAMPSILEGLGLSLQEALFRNCACIGSRVGGIPELIEDGVNGLLVLPGSVEDLSKGLDLLISDVGLRERLGAQGRASVIAKGMTAAQMVQEYVGLYKSILENKSHTANSAGH